MILLPSNGVAHAEPYFIDRGGILKSSLAGVDQRMDRIGSKWGCEFATKPLKANDAHIWIARLIRGRRERAQIKFPQPGLIITQSVDYTMDGPVGANAETAMFRTTSAAEAGKGHVEGQFFSVLASGRRYLHQVTVPGGVVVSAPSWICGNTFQPPLRTTVPHASAVTFINPLIEGYVGGDQTKWTVDNARIYGLAFVIEEAQ